MRTLTPAAESTTPSQQINVRTNLRFFKMLLKEKGRRGCSMGDVILRAAAVGFGMAEEAGICPKAPPGPRPRFQPEPRKRRNGSK